MSKLFVRERTRVRPGDGRPRFVVVAAEGTDLKLYIRHVRRAELEKLAEAVGAEVVYLPRGEHANGEGEGSGHSKKGRRGKHREDRSES